MKHIPKLSVFNFLNHFLIKNPNSVCHFNRFHLVKLLAWIRVPFCMAFSRNQTHTLISTCVDKNGELENVEFHISSYSFRFSSFHANVTHTWHACGSICLCLFIFMYWIIFYYTLILNYLFAWQIQRKYGFLTVKGHFLLMAIN